MISFCLMVLMIADGYFHARTLFIHTTILIGTGVAGELKNVKRKYEA